MAEDGAFRLLERTIDDAISVTVARWQLRGPDAEDFAQDVRVELFVGMQQDIGVDQDHR